MTIHYLLIQAIGILGTVSFFLSFQCKRNKNLFRVQFLSYLCYTIHLLMLGATTGGISYILNTVRSFCLGSKYTFLKGKPMCAIICAAQVVTLFLPGADGGPFFLLPPILHPQSADTPTMPGRSALPACLSILLCGSSTILSSVPGPAFWTKSSAKHP